MKKYLSIIMLPFVSTMVFAQSPSTVVVSLGGGMSSTSSSLKNNAQLDNGYLINTNVFVPFVRKGWDGTVKGGSKFALGVVAGAEYNANKNLLPDASTAQNMYKLYSGNLNVDNAQNGSANSHGFTGLAGLQADFSVGKITLSPSVSGAYFNLKQDGFAQSSQVTVNGTTQTVVLLASQPVESSGFIFKPQMKVSYPITGNLSVYAAGGIDFGPKITLTQSRLVPAGGFNEKNTYEPTQLANGSRNNQSYQSSFQTVTFTAGLSLGFGGGSESQRRLKGKITKPGDGGMLYTNAATEPLTPSQAVAEEHRTYTGGRRTEGSALVAGNPIGGIIVKGGKNPGGSMITVVADNNGEVELNGLEAGNYKFTLTAPEEPAGKSISQKGVSSTKGGSKSRVASPGQPIGGIVVKGGKNLGGNMMVLTTNNDGEIDLPNLEAGNYRFTILDQGEPAGKSISEKGVSSTKGRPQNMVASPGSPIGGIVVKGGKNPGGSMMVITSNNNGEIEFKGLKAGNYKFTITAPEEPAGKSISEKGVSSTKGRPKNMVASPGSPIGGIVVKGGKNPGGSMMIITTNNNGEFELNGLEAGDYKFTIIQPEQPSSKSISEKGLKRN